MIEVNLGIICACLIVLKQIVKRYFLSVFSMKPGRSHGYRHWQGSSGAARDVNKSSKHDPSGLRHHRHSHFQLEDTIDEDLVSLGIHSGDTESGRDVWAGGKSFQMHTLAKEPASDDERKIEEKSMVSIAVIEREVSHGSGNSVNAPSWKQPPGISTEGDIEPRTANR